MNKKKIVLVVGILVVIILVLLLLKSINKKEGGELVEEVFVPEFMTEERKAYYGLSPERKVQVFYDSEGNEIYKIIYDDSDIITDPLSE